MGARELYKPFQRTSDGMWIVQIELNPRDGKRRRKQLVASTERAVLSKRKDALKELHANGDLETASPTVAQWLTYWQKEIIAKKRSPKTAANYRTFSKRIANEIGNVRLDKLTTRHVHQVDNAITRELSATSAATAHRIMSSAFASAMSEGKMYRNPARAVEAPSIPNPQLDFLTIEEVTRLLDLFDDDTEKVLWFTYLMTGARRGEILGLEWDRVTDVLDLCWQLQRHPVEIVAPADYEYRRVDGGLYLTRPKTKAGWRIVPLVEPLSGVLRRWKEIAPTNEHGLVFARPDGKPFDPDYISKTWPKVLKAAGIEKKIRLHDLRHTTVVMLYAAEVSEADVILIVGHSVVSMSRAYRGRGDRDQLTRSMKKLSSLLGIES